MLMEWPLIQINVYIPDKRLSYKPLNSFNPEARLSQQLSSPKTAVDLNHLLLNGLPFKINSKFRQIF